jgi:predicted neuraminidase
MTWGNVGKCELPNPGSGIDAVKLANGHWALIFNNEKNSRATLSIAISEDEGRSWKQIRKLEDHKAGRYHYPAIIQGRDGLIHVIYSTFIAPEDGDETAKAKNLTLKGIKHATLNEAWIKAVH